MFPQRKHNGQLVLKMSCNILVLDHFNFMPTLLENIKIEQPQLSFYVNGMSTSKSNEYSMRKSQLQMLILTS